MHVTRVVEHIEEYSLSFTNSTGRGFGFDCTKDGQITRSWWSSLNYAIAGFCDSEYSLDVEDYSRDFKHYEGTCDCGTELIAYGGYDEFACESCNAEYNIYGQRLREGWRNNRSNWDESVSDMDGYEMANASY